MADSSWYSSANWNKEDQDLYYQKIAKSRNKKAFYSRIKALSLNRTKDPIKVEAAKRILIDALEEFKDLKFDLPEMAFLLAKWFYFDNNISLAKKYIEKYFDLIQQGKIASVSSGVSPEALYSEIQFACGNSEEKATRHIKDKYSKWENFSFENIKDKIIVDTSNNEINSPKDCGELIIIWHHVATKEIFDYSEDSLTRLDSLLGESLEINDYKISDYKRDFLNSLFIPALGSYIGEFLIKRFGGKWLINKPLMRCKLLIGKTQIDPYEFAYNVVYYRYPLMMSLELALPNIV